MIYTDEKTLVADEINELHEFAKSINLRPGWFVGGPMARYDIWHWPLVRAKKKGVNVVSTEWINDFLKKQKQNHHVKTRV